MARPISILVGEVSLDAHIGHLAALAGGQLFVVAAVGAEGAVLAAVGSMPRRHVAGAGRWHAGERRCAEQLPIMTAGIAVPAMTRKGIAIADAGYPASLPRSGQKGDDELCSVAWGWEP